MAKRAIQCDIPLPLLVMMMQPGTQTGRQTILMVVAIHRERAREASNRHRRQPQNNGGSGSSRISSSMATRRSQSTHSIHHKSDEKRLLFPS